MCPSCLFLQCDVMLLLLLLGVQTTARVMMTLAPSPLWQMRSRVAAVTCRTSTVLLLFLFLLLLLLTPFLRFSACPRCVLLAIRSPKLQLNAIPSDCRL